jgi:hypothetical protein
MLCRLHNVVHKEEYALGKLPQAVPASCQIPTIIWVYRHAALPYLACPVLPAVGCTLHCSRCACSGLLQRTASMKAAVAAAVGAATAAAAVQATHNTTYTEDLRRGRQQPLPVQQH